MDKKHAIPVRGMYSRPGINARQIGAYVLDGLCTEQCSAAAERVKRRSRCSDQQLVDMRIDPLDYDSNEGYRFFKDYVAVSLFSKFADLDLGKPKSEVAIGKFRDSEESCRVTNERLFSPLSTWPIGARLDHILFMAQTEIERVIGTEPDLEVIAELFKHGPGSTTRLPRRKGDAYHKFEGNPQTSTTCVPYAVAALRRIPLWAAESNLTVVAGNRITTVPKNAKTDRVIAIEPCMNMYIQKGIGAYMREKLKRKAGVNLDDQTINQKLAKEASLTGDLATLDLSAASDSISIALVWRLLPPAWFDLLDRVRSHEGMMPDGSRVEFQKFSSMGNGFTFELESLIFYALCKSTLRAYSTDHRLSVYGDDLIVPTTQYHRIVEMLDFFGFKANEDKSFHRGYFRESCGKHYFNGIDVTPLYIKGEVENCMDVISLCNAISLLASRLGGGLARDRSLLPAYELARSVLPSYWKKPRVPVHLGDIALHGDFDEVTPRRVNRRYGWEGFQCMGITQTFRTFVPDTTPYLIKVLDNLEGRYGSAESSASLNPVQIRSFRLNLKVVRPVASEWSWLGPWL